MRFIVLVWLVLLSSISHSDDADRINELRELIKDGRLMCDEIKANEDLFYQYMHRFYYEGVGSPPAYVQWDCDVLQRVQKAFPETMKLSAMINGFDFKAQCYGMGYQYKRAWNRDLALARISLLNPERLEDYSSYSRDDLRSVIADSIVWKEVDQYNKGMQEQFVSALQKEAREYEKQLISSGLSGAQSEKIIRAIYYRLFSSTFFISYDTHSRITKPMREAVAQGNDAAIREYLKSDDVDEVHRMLRALMLYGERAGDMLSVITPTMVRKLDDTYADVIALAGESGEKTIALLEAGFDPHRDNDFGKTPLFYAIQFNNFEGANALIDVGADVNAAYYNKNNPNSKPEKRGGDHCFQLIGYGRTPLMHAAQHGTIQMIDMLIDRGADTSMIDVHGDGVEYYAGKRSDGKGDEILQHIKKRSPTRTLAYRLDLEDSVAADIKRRLRVPTDTNMVAQDRESVAIVYGAGLRGTKSENYYLIVNFRGRILGPIDVGVFNDGSPLTLEGVDRFSPRKLKFSSKGDIQIIGMNHLDRDPPCCPSSASYKTFRAQGFNLFRVR